MSISPCTSTDPNFEIVLSNKPSAPDLPLMLGCRKGELQGGVSRILGSPGPSWVKNCHRLPHNAAKAEEPILQFQALRYSCQCTSGRRGQTVANWSMSSFHQESAELTVRLARSIAAIFSGEASSQRSGRNSSASSPYTSLLRLSGRS